MVTASEPVPKVTWQEAAKVEQARIAALWPEEYKAKNLPDDSVLDVHDFPAKSGVLTEREVAITQSLTCVELLEAIAKGTYTAVEVTVAFCKRATIAQQLLNCLTEAWFDKAIARAEELDKYYKETGKTVGPLHGLPISLKDQVEVKGTYFTMSYVGRVGNIAKHDAVITELLIKQGAVLYVRTNMAQGLWAGEGYNNVHGRTTNPFNRNLTCGGSSGGEGALVGIRGSLLGVGSDIGGSVRLPSAYQGIYGMRGCYSRIPYAKCSNSSEGQESVRSILGPLSASLDGIKLFYESVLAAKPWEYDPWTPRMPWNDAAYNLTDHGDGGKLCFAVMWSDGVVDAVPPYKRAMEELKAALEAQGHEVIEWKAFKQAESAELLTTAFSADGWADLYKQLGVSGEPRLGTVMEASAPTLSITEYFEFNYRRTAYITEALEYWNATKSQTSTGRPVDFVICPAAACAPSRHGDKLWIGYTGWCNLTDYAAAVLPVTKVDPAIDTKPARTEFHTDMDKYNYSRYDPEAQKNAPISLQVVGKKYEEEAVIRALELADEALKSYRASEA